MKKFLIIIILLAQSAVYAEMTDINNHWGQEWIEEIMETGISEGYPDHTFRPDDNISIEEYLTLVLKALEHQFPGKYPIETMANYWADPWIYKATEIGLIEEDEFSDYRRMIKREEVASIIMHAYRLNHTLSQSRLTTEIAEELYDYYLIEDEYIDEMLTAIKDGFITGKDKRGKLIVVDPKGPATRAEAAVVIGKLMRKDKRTPFFIDRPQTVVMIDKWNGAESVEEEIIFYAPKNADGDYVTEIFEVYKWFEEHETDRIKAYYSPQSDNVVVDFRCDPKYEADYEGEFWVAERSDMSFMFDSSKYSTIMQPYTLIINKKDRMSEGKTSAIDYLIKEYLSELEIIGEILFNQSYEDFIAIIKNQLNDPKDPYVYTINNVKIYIAGHDTIQLEWGGK